MIAVRQENEKFTICFEQQSRPQTKQLKSNLNVQLIAIPIEIEIFRDFRQIFADFYTISRLLCEDC